MINEVIAVVVLKSLIQKGVTGKDADQGQVDAFRAALFHHVEPGNWTVFAGHKLITPCLFPENDSTPG